MVLCVVRLCRCLVCLVNSDVILGRMMCGILCEVSVLILLGLRMCCVM